MSEKIFNTRIIHKHDIEANWNKAINFVPKQGELIIYDIDENYDYQRMKIGDGVKNIINLPFIDQFIIDTLDNLITPEDIDEICGSSIILANEEVLF